MDETLLGLILRLEGICDSFQEGNMELEKFDGCFFSKFGSSPFFRRDP